jgi:hypothetical protein
MKPHIQPPMTVSQRVVVQAEGADPVTIDLRERLVNAFIARPAAGQSETVMIFSNQDADFESADPLYHFGKPFAWSLFVARIMPAGPRFYPGARPPAPGSWHDGSMRQAVAALSGMSVAEIADSFIVLGNCCEFTNHQRAEGCDRASLLRLTAFQRISPGRAPRASHVSRRGRWASALARHRRVVWYQLRDAVSHG